MNTMKKCSTCGTLYEGDLCARCVAGFAQSPTNPTAPPEELPLKAGQTFRGLEILELIGRGGMGVVYKARQPALDRLVALKILPKRMATDPDFQNRFIREAKALASLNHPNIVSVYDFGADAGLFFFAMEFVDGTNLRQILRDKTLKPEQALKIVPQLCDALEFAHAEGVVHRDIKPENILLDKKGRVKIADFGLAKLTGADSQHANLTMTNMVMGTPHYMAPEQVENPKGVDHRADIYAIGVVFYEMLTGELPIGRFEMPSKKVQIDVRLDEVVLKTLEKSPEARYQKAGEVRDAITRATSVDAYMPTVMTPRPEKKSKAPLALLGVGLLGLGILTGVLFRGGPAAPPVVAPTTAAAPVPVDLTPLHFGPDDRPGRYIWAQPEAKVLPKNPIVAKTPEEIGQLITYLAAIGLANLSPADLKQGYAAVWFRGMAAVVGLETPDAERIEKAFLGMKDSFTYQWTHRKGERLVLAWCPDRDDRRVFEELVAMVQKKLALPVEPPPFHIDDLKWNRGAAPSGWSIVELKDFLGRPVPGARASWIGGFKPADDPLGVTIGFFDFADPKDAQAAETALRASAGARRVDAYRVRNLVAAAALTGDALNTYAKLGQELRDRLGLPSWTFEHIVPVPGELPAGWTIDRVDADPASVLREFELTKVQPSDVARAWRASFKPSGSVVALEIPDDDIRNAVEAQFRKIHPAWRTYSFVVAVEGSDDETLDVLENLMREKCGWDRNSQRPIHLRHLRFQAADLPKGFELGAFKTEAGALTQEFKTPHGPLIARVTETNNYAAQRNTLEALPYTPGDLLLQQNFVTAHMPGPEAAWDSIEALEAVFRKKMRMGPPSVEDLPDGYRKGDRFVRLWTDSSRERAEIKKHADAVGIDARSVAAIGYYRRDVSALLFQLRQAPAGPVKGKAGWVLVTGRGAFVAALPEPVEADAVEAVRGILRARK
jgi:tRNA A-37 threonylcarbamoyl transferase component Bud32